MRDTANNILYMEIGLTNRLEILAASLILEGYTSAFLATLLGIKDYTNSKTLGNKGGCLSFNQKVDLLIEIEALSKTDRKKFQAFMEIRNQFIHNISATTYEKCLASTNGTDKFLIKTYPQLNNHSTEEKLKAASKELCNDIIKITVSLKNKIYDKVQKEVELDFAKKSEQAFIEAIGKVKTSLDNFFDEEIVRSPAFNSKRFKGFGSELSKMLFSTWKKEFDKQKSPENEKYTIENGASE